MEKQRSKEGEAMETLKEMRQTLARLEMTIIEKDASLKDCYEHMEGQNGFLQEKDRKLQLEEEKNEIITRALKDSTGQCDSLQKDLKRKDADLREVQRQLIDALKENRDLKEQYRDMAKHLEEECDGLKSGIPIPCTSALSSGNFPIPCSSLDREQPPQEGVWERTSSGYQTSAFGCESMESDNKTGSKLTSVGLEGQLAFLQRDAARLREWYAVFEEKERTIESLKNENERYKVEVETITRTQSVIEDQCKLQLKDLALRTDEIEEAQRQHAECNKRLQQVEGELALVKTKLKEVESEKSYMDHQLCAYLKDFDEEKCKFEEQEKALSDAERKNTELKEYIQKLEAESVILREGGQLGILHLPVCCTSAPSSLNTLPPVPCSSMGTRCHPTLCFCPTQQGFQGAQPNGYQPPITLDQLTAPASGGGGSKQQEC
ncbi:hypothetical protein EMCRGX_G018347 [Ephydatia muelleri]